MTVDKIITLHGKPVTLVGKQLKVGTLVPDFAVLDTDLKPVTRAAFDGKISIICSVPSLDTPVCDVEMRRFNQEAVKLGPRVHIAVISMDLPFAQKRWCGAAGVANVQALSDHRDASFGQAFGVLVKEVRLLARAVFVIDSASTLRYVEVVPEITHEPDYAAALQALKGMP